MHGPRLPRSPGAKEVDLGAVVMHLQYLDDDRMRSKQRWYQAEERVSYPAKRPIQIYRQYHHMNSIPREHRHPLSQDWLDAFDRIGVNLLEVHPRDAYPTDERILAYFTELGGDRFRRIDIWDVNWSARAAALDLPADGVPDDPRTRADRLVLRWLARTQPQSRTRPVRWIQRALRLAGW
jgi:hypothetical protein